MQSGKSLTSLKLLHFPLILSKIVFSLNYHVISNLEIFNPLSSNCSVRFLQYSPLELYVICEYLPSLTQQNIQHFKPQTAEI